MITEAQAIVRASYQGLQGVVMNTDEVLGIWHNGLNMIYQPFLSLAYENAVPNIPETHSAKVALGAFKEYYLWSNGLVVKTLDYQSRGPKFKTTGWLQGVS